MKVKFLIPSISYPTIGDERGAFAIGRKFSMEESECRYVEQLDNLALEDCVVLMPKWETNWSVVGIGKIQDKLRATPAQVFHSFRKYEEWRLLNLNYIKQCASTPEEPGFFMIWCKKRSIPTVEHATFGAAKAEADRLSSRELGEKFHILRAVGYSQTPKPPTPQTIYKPLRLEDDDPSAL